MRRKADLYQFQQRGVTAIYEHDGRQVALTQAYLRSVLDYDPLTGVFTWRMRPREAFQTAALWLAWNAKNGGRIAGHPEKGYIRIGLLGRLYRAHRLAWLYVYGWLPRMVDHKNKDRADNRITNLRASGPVHNGRNQKLHSTNKSGYAGVCRVGTKWLAYIHVNGKQKKLGYFISLDEAVEVRKNAETALGFSTLHGCADA